MFLAAWSSLKIIPYCVPFLMIPYILFLKIRQVLKKEFLINRRVLLSQTNPILETHPPVIIGYFHPYCNSGGGGERVLWTMIQSLQSEKPYMIHAIYTGDIEVTKEEMLNNVKTRFDLNINPDTVELIHLYKRKWVEAKTYPRFTMLGQSLGSMVLAWEAMSKLIPDIYFDTMGYAFTYPIVNGIAECKVGTYTHYPTISTDMLEAITSRDTLVVNNDSLIANSYILSQFKLIYYKLFSKLYGWAGSFASTVMVNSSWTKGHIDKLWSLNSKVIYPPCDTDQFSKLKVEGRKLNIVSIAQFRPEKDHPLQLYSLHDLLINNPSIKALPIKLILIGSVRNSIDEDLVNSLKELSIKLKIESYVEFKINVSFNELKQIMSTAIMGLHTMKNEHFGIGVVELLASGAIPIAHNSAGPKMDILNVKDESGKECLGFLAITKSEYANCIKSVLDLYQSDSSNLILNMKRNQELSHFFSNHQFHLRFSKAFDELLQ